MKSVVVVLGLSLFCGEHVGHGVIEVFRTEEQSMAAVSCSSF